MKIRICQISSKTGDVNYNFHVISKHYLDAVHDGCDICIFPELATLGCLSGDLLLHRLFVNEVLLCNERLLSLTKDTYLLLPTIIQEGDKLFNVVIVARDGVQVGISYKSYLSNYGIFSESRYFTSGEIGIFDIHNKKMPTPKKIAITIGDDMLQNDICNYLLSQNLDLVLALNASPFETYAFDTSSLETAPFEPLIFKKNKIDLRIAQTQKLVNLLKIPIIYCNAVFAQDGVVFDGNSFICNYIGDRIVDRVTDIGENASNDIDQNVDQMDDELETVMCCKAFLEDCATALYRSDRNVNELQITGNIISQISREESIYCAMVMGLREYVHNNGFTKVLLGISGGIDSALVALIASDAFGSSNVDAVMLQSKFNSVASVDDATMLAKNLGINFSSNVITPIIESFSNILSIDTSSDVADLTYQNLQSRIRGTILMGISNNTGALLLTTGNKSECATGYATLYGDMNGGFNPIKDLYKTQVYEIARYRNNNIPKAINICVRAVNIIPLSILEKEPSAELSYEQKDSDSLPAYQTLDKILEMYIGHNLSAATIVDCGYSKDIVDYVINLIKKSEFKRKQSAPGVKLSTSDFDMARRYPITSK